MEKGQFRSHLPPSHDFIGTRSFLQVRNYLEALQPAASPSPAIDLTTLTNTNLTSTTADLNTTTITRKDSVEFTDIQLLAYLTQFEEKNRQDKEMTMAITHKGKVRID